MLLYTTFGPMKMVQKETNGFLLLTADESLANQEGMEFMTDCRVPKLETEKWPRVYNFGLNPPGWNKKAYDADDAMQKILYILSEEAMKISSLTNALLEKYGWNKATRTPYDAASILAKEYVKLVEAFKKRIPEYEESIQVHEVSNSEYNPDVPEYMKFFENYEVNGELVVKANAEEHEHFAVLESDDTVFVFITNEISRLEKLVVMLLLPTISQSKDKFGNLKNTVLIDTDLTILY